MLKPRTRLISVRINDEELSNYRAICACEGFVSFSDLVRTAIHELIANRSGRGPGAIRSAVNELSTRIEKLDQDVKELLTPSHSNGR
jgi:Arc/MetJ-type ribon-helix-helix transcriptional regulator